MLKSVKHYALFLFGLFAFAQAQANPLSLSEQQVNKYLAKTSEIQDKFGFPGLFSMDYKILNMQAKIGENNSGRVQLSGGLDSSLQIQGKNLSGKLNLTFDTVPYYDAEKGAIYLKDLRILSWSGEPNDYMAQLQSFMPFLSKSIATLLESVPIYTLDDSNPRDALIKKFAKGIKVEQGRLSIEAMGL